MSTDAYGSIASASRATPQTEKASPEQVPNSAGGFTFAITPLERAKRFLILGSDAGSYYAGAGELTAANATSIMSLIGNDVYGPQLVEAIVDISTRGLAPKVQPSLFALALAATKGSDATRAAANAALTTVARTGTHLLTFVRYADALAGWSRGRRTAVSSWFLDKTPDALAFQAVKYRSRDGWALRDVMRVAHPSFGKVVSPETHGVLDWIAGRGPEIKFDDESGTPFGDELPKIIQGFQYANGPGVVDHAFAVREYGLTWEMLPDTALANTGVWDALLDNMLAGKGAQTALVRQLPRLTKLGIVGPMGSGRTKDVVDLLTSEERLKKGRVHPISLLIAAKTYARGTQRSGDVYRPVTAILDALDNAFYKAFESAEAANKRTLIGLDVSGSMGGATDPSGILTAREVGGAMALVLTATEPWSEVYGFTARTDGRGGYGYRNDTAFTPLSVSPKERLDSLNKRVSALPFGRTDCALPMTEALRLGLEVDTFVVITDNETYHGSIHPHQALEEYRRKTGIPAKLVVLSVTATSFSIANPNDSGMLDVPGFGSDVPALVTNFSRGF